jgi:hypothetical protein
MLELSEEGRRVVEALIKGPVAWQSPLEVASTIGLGLEETIDLLAGLDADGWLSAWEREADVVVTLSVVAAAILEVRLVESGRDETPRWARRGDPEPPAPRASGVFRDERAASLERVVDPSGSPEEAAERAEEALRRSTIPWDPRERVSLEGLPAPTLLIGLGLTPWPGPLDGREAPCPSCQSRRLGPSMYCLYCDRWGLDHRLVDGPAPRIRSPRSPAEVAGQRKSERQARKAKRRARRVAQATPRRRPGRTLPPSIDCH